MTERPLSETGGDRRGWQGWRLPALPQPARLVLALAAGFGLLAGGALLVNDRVSAWLLRRDAETTAVRWAETLQTALGGELPRMMQRVVPSAEALQQLRQAQRIGDVFRFRLFDAAGDLVFQADDLAVPEALAGSGAAQPGPAALPPGSGTRVTAHRGTTPGQPARYAEAHVPAMYDGQQLGMAEVHVDQSARYILFRDTFALIGGGTLLLLLLAAAFPGWVALRGNRQREAAEEWVRFLAQHDPLTDLPNRARHAEALAAALARARRDGSLVAVMSIDLDRFKEVNDSLGHAAGDQLLRAVAERLARITRAEDTVARVGGDEFALVQVGVEQPADAARLADRLLALLAQPYDLPAGARGITCGASIGVALAPTDGDDGETLMRTADAALYRAKADGRGTARFFEPGMDEALAERRRLTQELRLAVAEGRFELAYQPLQSLANGALAGFEALLRWPHPERGSVSPAEFIPLAEETGLIVPIGALVLRRACREAALWPAEVKVAVNLSPAQFRDGPALVQTVRDALAAAGLPATRLELEVTEGLLMHDTEAVLAVLGELRALGCSIAMDDFGTGYSSLAYLWRFPFDKLKIDRSFVAGMSREPKAAAIVATIVALGRTLGLVVTAEGIETERQAAALKAAGCDLGQGYLLGRPMPAEAARLLLATMMGAE